jgi:endoglucanase
VGAQLVDQAGNPVQLKGVSSMWLNWEPTGYAESKEALRWMRDNWQLTVIRAAMGVEPRGAYLSSPGTARHQVNTIVENAIELGVYVIIDWHDSNALSHRAAAVGFFAEMAQKYGAAPNVLYETFNEPLEVDWARDLKAYHQAVVDTIRSRDPDNPVILGTPRWSQLVLAPSSDPVLGQNLLYTLHFYACTHGSALRSTGETALGRGVPLFVSEWGATNADGGLDGLVCASEARQWLDWMKTRQLSWTAWKLDDCVPDSSCLLRANAPLSGGWTDEWLHGHASVVREYLLAE